MNVMTGDSGRVPLAVETPSLVPDAATETATEADEAVDMRLLDQVQMRRKAGAAYALSQGRIAAAFSALEQEAKFRLGRRYPQGADELALRQQAGRDLEALQIARSMAEVVETEIEEARKEALAEGIADIVAELERGGASETAEFVRKVIPS